MFETDLDSLRVNVPVGFLLAEPREIVVSVDRPTSHPLAIRLRLIPAGPPESEGATSPLPVRSARRLLAWDADDGYPHPEYGGGD